MYEVLKWDCWLAFGASFDVKSTLRLGVDAGTNANLDDINPNH